MLRLADKYKCSGCLSCVDSCSTGALSSYWNEEGHLTYKIDQSKCVGCRKCEKNCPAINSYLYSINDLKLSKPYASWCLDKTLRETSTSGGVFAALAKQVLSQGGIVIGASMVDSYVKHIAIEKVEDLHLLQGSKYTQSDTSGIYKLTSQYLKLGKIVLFSGLGCQIAGLLNYLPESITFKNLITLDLICGGVPSRHIITKYLEQNVDVKEIAAFRNKSKYEFSVFTKDGKRKTIPLAERPFPLCGFYTELTNKYICYECPYVGAHRNSDITIGDLWGDVEFLEQHKEGLSVAVVHSEKGKQWLGASEIEMHEISWENFLLHNPRMVFGKNILGKCQSRALLAEAFRKDSYKDLLTKYANAASIKSPINMLRKVFRFLRGKYEHKKIIKEVHNIIKTYK